MNKVLVIGLDGATWGLIQPWMDQGRLPHLASLQQQGAWGNLRSTIPAMTSAAWSSFATSREPSNTGIFNFYYREEGTYRVRINTRLQIRGTSLWRVLSQHGRRFITINVPMTYPAEEDLNGLMITGIPTPDKESPGFTCPRDLFDQYHLDQERYRITVRLPEYEGRYSDLIEDLKEMVRQRSKVAQTLIREPWDFFMVHFFATDVAQHALWKFSDPDHPLFREEGARECGDGLFEIFSEVDRSIARLLERVDRDHTTVMVLSDHGFGPSHFTVHINRWLLQNGMLALHNPLPHLANRLSSMLAARRFAPLQLGARGLKFALYSAGDRMPRSWQDRLQQFLKAALSGSPRWSTLFRLQGYPAMFDATDWRKTRAYSVGTSGLIYINLKGREPQGIVSRGKEYEDVRESIREKLLDLRDADGQPVLDGVFRREEIYRGKFLEESPDLIPVSERVCCYFYPFLDRDGLLTGTESFRSGNHRIDGIFIAQGPGVDRNQRTILANIIDVAPTILYLLDVPMPGDVDGSVIEEILDPEYVKRHAVQRSDSPPRLQNKEDIGLAQEEKIAKQLKDLGYL